MNDTNHAVENPVEIEVSQFLDRSGVCTSMWATRFYGHVVAVEFTRGASGLTDRAELAEAA